MLPTQPFAHSCRPWTIIGMPSIRRLRVWDRGACTSTASDAQAAVPIVASQPVPIHRAIPKGVSLGQIPGSAVSDEYNARTSGTMSGQCMSTVIRSTPLSSRRHKTYAAFVCIGRSRCRHMPLLSQVWVFFMQNGSSFQECWKVIE